MTLFVLSLLACTTTTPDALAGDAPAAAAAGWTHYGAPFTVTAAVPASAVLGAPQDHAKAPVRMTGELTEVCQKAGCWAVIRDDAGHSIRVTMKDHAFGIAKDAAGKACDLEGTLVKKAVDPATVEHYKSEGSSGAPEAGKAETWELVVTAASVK